MKTHEEGDQPIRYMACHYVHDIIKESAVLLLEITRPDSIDWKLGNHIEQIERLLELVRFNLQKPK